MILRLPAGLRWADDFARAYSRARGLSPPTCARAAAITMRGAHRGAAIPKDGRDRAHDRLSVRDRADPGGSNPLEAPSPPRSPRTPAPRLFMNLGLNAQRRDGFYCGRIGLGRSGLPGTSLTGG